MKKGELKLEFEYSSKRFKNEIGVDVVNYTIRPIGDMKEVFPKNYETCLASVDEPGEDYNLFSFAARNLLDSAFARTSGSLTFSEKAYFKDKDNGKTIEVKPATITWH